MRTLQKSQYKNIFFKKSKHKIDQNNTKLVYLYINKLRI